MNYRRGMLRTLVLGGVAVLLLQGCASRKFQPITRLSAARPTTFVERTIEKKVSAAALKVACELPGGVQSLRLVPVYRRELGNTAGLPEYRLFEIRPKGPYALVGLETADVLLAANDYVLYEPDKFRTYVCILAQEKQGWINIVRNGLATKLLITVE